MRQRREATLVGFPSRGRFPGCLTRDLAPPDPPPECGHPAHTSLLAFLCPGLRENNPDATGSEVAGRAI